MTTTPDSICPLVPIDARIGVLGAGGRMCSVLEMLLRIAPGVRITAVYDPDPVSIARCRFTVASHAAVCASEAEVCGRADVDWVFIGSWNSLHAAHAVAAFAAGKHVFCEKPLALDLEEAARMHTAWRASGRIFALGLVLRYSPLYRAARAAIDAGKIGRLLSFEFNETLVFNHGGYIHGNWRRHTRNAGSHLLEKCCHDLDLAFWLAGDLPARVASFGGRTFFTSENRVHQERIGPNSEGRTAFESWADPARESVNPFTDDKDIVDHQVAILEFGGGVRATFHTHCMAALPERRFYLLGSEGTLRLDAYTGKLELRRVGWDEPVDVSNPIDGDGHAGADEPMARELAECMAGLRTPAAGFTEGVRSLVVAQAVDQAMHEGRVVDLAPLWARVGAFT
jgi:predicted dehydrogenase